MTFSDFFHNECDPVELHESPDHGVFSCIQWKDPSLRVMKKAAKQRLAIMYGDRTNPINPYVSAALERAYVLGAMSAVKLIAIHEDTMYLFLDDEVSSTTFQEIESLWIQVMCMSPIRLEVNFANVSELHSGHSDYLFWQNAKEILESYSLGIKQYDLASLDDFSHLPSIDDHVWAYLSQGANAQPEALQHWPVEMQNMADMVEHSKCIMSPYYIYPDNRKPAA